MESLLLDTKMKIKYYKEQINPKMCLKLELFLLKKNHSVTILNFHIWRDFYSIKGWHGMLKAAFFAKSKPLDFKNNLIKFEARTVFTNL